MKSLPVLAFVAVTVFAVGCGPAGSDAEGFEVAEAALIDGEFSDVAHPTTGKIVADGKWTIDYATRDANGLVGFAKRPGGSDKPSFSAESLPTLADVMSQPGDLRIPTVVVTFDPPSASAGGGAARTLEASASCRPTILRETQTWDFEAVRCRVLGNDAAGVRWTVEVAFDDSGKIDDFTILGGIVENSEGRWAGHVSFDLNR